MQQRSSSQPQVKLLNNWRVFKASTCPSCSYYTLLKTIRRNLFSVRWKPFFLWAYTKYQTNWWHAPWTIWVHSSAIVLRGGRKFSPLRSKRVKNSKRDGRCVKTYLLLCFVFVCTLDSIRWHFHSFHFHRCRVQMKARIWKLFIPGLGSLVLSEIKDWWNSCGQKIRFYDENKQHGIAKLLKKTPYFNDSWPSADR